MTDVPEMVIKANGNVGVGTANPATNLHVQSEIGGTAYTGTALAVSNDRPGIMLTGTYPHLVIGSSVNNANHAGTLSFWHNNNGGGTTSMWNMGASDAGLSIGYGTNNGNPHVGLENYTTPTVMSFETNGNVGIGTIAPAARLHVSNGDASYALFGPNATWNSYLYVGAGGNTISANRAQVISTNGNLHLDAGVGQNIYIANYNGSNTFMQTGGGNLGVGTTSPSYKVHAAGDIYANGGWMRVSGNNGLHFESYGTGIHAVQADGGQYGSVSTYGNVGGWEGYSIAGRYVFMANGNQVGLYNDVDNRWQILINRGTNDQGFLFYNSNTGNQNMRIQHTNGTRYASYDGDSNWDFYSDRRLKEHIENEGNILGRLLKLDVVNYHFIDEDIEEKEIGFIAQEVEQYFPSLVSEATDDRYDFKVKALGYSSFGVLAIGGIKELKLETDENIAGLNQNIAEMKAEIEELKALVKNLLDNQK